MPSPVSIILVAMLSGDVLWWRWADRRVRRLPHALGWRLCIGLFMGGQMAVVLWSLGGRVAAASFLVRPPYFLSAAADLWHLLLLPAGWAFLTTTGLLFGAWRGGRVRVGAGRGLVRYCYWLLEVSANRRRPRRCT